MQLTRIEQILRQGPPGEPAYQPAPLVGRIERLGPFSGVRSTSRSLVATVALAAALVVVGTGVLALVLPGTRPGGDGNGFGAGPTPLVIPTASPPPTPDESPSESASASGVVAPPPGVVGSTAPPEASREEQPTATFPIFGCTDVELKAAVLGISGAAGSRGIDLRLVHAGDGPCYFGTNPRMQLLDDGTVLADTLVTNPGDWNDVLGTLDPGVTLDFTALWSNWCGPPVGPTLLLRIEASGASFVDVPVTLEPPPCLGPGQQTALTRIAPPPPMP